MTIVSCNHCKKKYRVAGAFTPSTLKAKFRCKHCGNLFSIREQLAKVIKSDQETENNFSENPNNTGEHGIPALSAYNLSGSKQNAVYKAFKKLTLRKKFTFALIGIMFFSLLGTYLISSYIFQKNAENQINKNARFLLTTIEASRSFTSKVVKPALYNELPDKFVVEAMSSSFGARNIFERIKKKYPEYYFKHASLNPRNNNNLADQFEVSIIRKFIADPDLAEWQGYRTIKKNTDFIIMKPIVAEVRCMKCHSIPDKAPQEMLERYGDKAGFGRRPGDIIGALSISVPTSEIFAIARIETVIVNLIVCVCFIFLIVIINLFFRRIVIKPIDKLKMIVEEISVGKTNIAIEAEGNDEINQLARGFERMRVSVNLALSRLKITSPKENKKTSAKEMAIG